MRRKEIWKNIIGYEGLYQISNYGRVKSIRFGKEIIRTASLRAGYLALVFSVNGIRETFSIHILVGKHFVKGWKPNLEINHKKGIKTDNRAWMLEWVTRGQNLSHKFKVLGIENKGGVSRIKVKQYTQSGKLKNTFESLSEASRNTGIDISQISGCINKKKKYKTGGGYVWKK